MTISLVHQTWATISLFDTGKTNAFAALFGFSELARRARRFYKKKLNTGQIWGSVRIETLDGMVGITGDRFSYSNIRGMYQTGSGHVLQLSADLEHKRGELLDLFSGIAEKIYEAQDVIRR